MVNTKVCRPGRPIMEGEDQCSRNPFLLTTGLSPAFRYKHQMNPVAVRRV